MTTLAFRDRLKFAPRMLGDCFRLYGHWYLLITFAVIWFGMYFSININVSPSLPQRVFLTHKGEPVGRGDYVSFRWHGGWPYKEGERFTKRIAGVPGDRVERIERSFYVNGLFAGIAKPKGLAGQPLEMMEPGILGDGEYYVMAPHPDSLDSRYKLTGWVKQAEIIGRAYPLF